MLTDRSRQGSRRVRGDIPASNAEGYQAMDRSSSPTRAESTSHCWHPLHASRQLARQLSIGLPRVAVDSARS